MRSKTAGPWAERKLDQHKTYTRWLKSSDVNNEPDKAFYGWIDFVQQFKDQFGDPDPQLTTQIKLKGIVQGSRTCDEYATEFEMYRPRPASMTKPLFACINEVSIDRFWKRSITSALCPAR
jgi:Retrotransposon gag protein